VNVLLPLLIAAMAAHAMTVLTMRRSILTEKLSRRGYHLSREYAIDPLEITLVREVMRTNIIAFPAEVPLADLKESLSPGHSKAGQWLYPMVDGDKTLLNVVTRRELEKLVADAHDADRLMLIDLVEHKPSLVVAYPDEPLRVIVNRMARSGFTRLPVIDRRARRRDVDATEHTEHHNRTRSGTPAASRLIGLISLTDLLRARVVNLEAETKRQRVLPIRLFVPGMSKEKIDE
jgi:CIC family chloride channel protein